MSYALHVVVLGEAHEVARLHGREIIDRRLPAQHHKRPQPHASLHEPALSHTHGRSEARRLQHFGRNAGSYRMFTILCPVLVAQSVGSPASVTSRMTPG
eukprot:COSAG02_NODE_2463_length_8788_cov_3.119001_4_plen_99_part_00